MWRPVIEVSGLGPAVSEVLARCAYFLVDGECGGDRGVVGQVLLDAENHPTALVVLQGWRRRVVVPVGEIVEISPGERRLTVACSAGPDDHGCQGSISPRRMA